MNPILVCIAVVVAIVVLAMVLLRKRGTRA